MPVISPDRPLTAVDMANWTPCPESLRQLSGRRATDDVIAAFFFGVYVARYHRLTGGQYLDVGMMAEFDVAGVNAYGDLSYFHQNHGWPLLMPDGGFAWLEHPKGRHRLCGEHPEIKSSCMSIQAWAKYSPGYLSVLLELKDRVFCATLAEGERLRPGTVPPHIRIVSPDSLRLLNQFHWTLRQTTISPSSAVKFPPMYAPKPLPDGFVVVQAFQRGVGTTDASEIDAEIDGDAVKD